MPRLSAEARKEAIVEAVQDIFAEKGFDGTTIKELAQVAGVSEALLYKHFPSKESLYAAMLDACSKGPTFAEASRILEFETSTSTLVMMAHFMISHYVLGLVCTRRPMLGRCTTRRYGVIWAFGLSNMWRSR
ncbi:MAG: transcriptional regulator [Deltaproteobacteria bacterium]|nr:transcriptional regulator [Deltaproteobacteria bacterium]